MGAVGKSAQTSINKISQAILSQVLQYSEGKLVDDALLLTIKLS
jgi:hypothetical protein